MQNSESLRLAYGPQQGNGMVHIFMCGLRSGDKATGMFVSLHKLDDMCEAVCMRITVIIHQ